MGIKITADPAMSVCEACELAKHRSRINEIHTDKRRVLVICNECLTELSEKISKVLSSSN